ncbi:unnamed protein product [Orchesella dallaii]|uniref:F-box domain-containing protein n=1 Tax=Orchesella dallaii TaxID=48710 RepID=A0ABP1RYW6_9HEXA
MSEFVGNICDLPPELQHEILSKLTDVNDIQSAINTCPQWHDILEYRKTAMLFAKVLPIMIEKGSYCGSIENMLLLRQVSKDWKRETDRQLSLYPFGYFLGDEGKGYHFSEVEEIQKFLTHASTFPDGANPILGNALSLSIADHEDMAPVFHLIRQYGTYIKTISLGYGNDNFPLNQLQSLLNLLPNVEWLIICVRVENWNEVEAPGLPPLPLLTKLTLEIEDSDDIIGPNYIEQRQLFIGSLVAAYGPQLESISCSPILLRVESISDLLPNLTSLEIDEGYTYTSFTNEDVHTLTQSGWELKCLQIGRFGKSPIQCSTELMGMLNNFSETLVTLDLSLQLDRWIDPSRLLVFPCLEIVKLRVSSTFDVLPEWMKDWLSTFSVVCPNLKKLKILTEGTMMNNAVSHHHQLQFEEMKNVFPHLLDLVFIPSPFTDRHDEFHYDIDDDVDNDAMI